MKLCLKTYSLVYLLNKLFSYKKSKIMLIHITFVKFVVRHPRVYSRYQKPYMNKREIKAVKLLEFCDCLSQ